MHLTGVWTRQDVAEFVAEAVIPMRLAVQDNAGIPLVLSLWFVPLDDDFWCATNQNAHLIRLIGRDPRCGFELAPDTPPYRGVRGQGVASLHPQEGASILKRLLSRYDINPDSKLSRLLTAKSDEEVAIRISPDRLTSWDFRKRMQGAIDPVE